MPKKIKLRKPKNTRRDERIQETVWKYGPPFFLSPYGILVHRVRDAMTMIRAWSPRPTHHAHYWCGNQGHGEADDFLFVPPETRIVCAACEKFAVSHGEPTSDEIVGHHVHVGRLRAVRTCCSDAGN